MFAGKTRAYQNGALSGVPFKDRLLYLPTNIGLSWRNTQAYYKHSLIQPKKVL